jgi:hypothetical protein
LKWINLLVLYQILKILNNLIASIDSQTKSWIINVSIAILEHVYFTHSFSKYKLIKTIISTFLLSGFHSFDYRLYKFKVLGNRDEKFSNRAFSRKLNLFLNAFKIKGKKNQNDKRRVCWFIRHETVWTYLYIALK